MGLVPYKDRIKDIACSYCDNIFTPSAYQYRRYYNGNPVACCEKCENVAKQCGHKDKPWGWLRTPHTLDNLPHWIEPEDIYVGY